MPRSDWAAVPGACAAVAVWAGLCGLIWDGVKLGHGRRVPGRSWAAVEGIRKAPERVRLQGWAVYLEIFSSSNRIARGRIRIHRKAILYTSNQNGAGVVPSSMKSHL